MGQHFPGHSSSSWEYNFWERGLLGINLGVGGGCFFFFSTWTVLSRNAENSVLMSTFYNIILFLFLFLGSLKRNRGGERKHFALFLFSFWYVHVICMSCSVFLSFCFVLIKLLRYLSKTMIIIIKKTLLPKGCVLSRFDVCMFKKKIKKISERKKCSLIYVN